MSDDDDFMQDSGDEEYWSLHFSFQTELTVEITVTTSNMRMQTRMSPVTSGSRTNTTMPSRSRSTIQKRQLTSSWA